MHFFTPSFKFKLHFLGPVFGAADYFHGLGVFLDTYANHKYNQKKLHSHPIIAVMVNNGSWHYDHNRDGGPGVLNYCSAKIRSVPHETHLGIRFEDNNLYIRTDVESSYKWKKCLHFRGVYLPYPGYLGLSSNTGDFSDNHDVLGFKFYNLESKTGQKKRASVPSISYQGVPNKLPENEGKLAVKVYFILFFAILGVIILLSIGYLYFQDKREEAAIHKRLY